MGGSDAGISAAFRAREVDPSTDITLVLADDYPNFSICGIPFFLSREVGAWQNLAHRNREQIESKGIRILSNTFAAAIDPIAHTVVLRRSDGTADTVSYDKLVLGTGAKSNRPLIKGLENPGVFTLRWIDEARAIADYIAEHKPKNVLLVGGGYINMELCDAFTLAGLKVTVIEHNAAVLKTIDPEFGKSIGSRLISRGVNVRCGRRVFAIHEKRTGLLGVILDAGGIIETNLVVVAAGARPETRLAGSAGAELGASGAVKITQRMETTVPDIYAAGDCAETFHAMLGRPVYLPLGSTSHKQGRIAGENAVGGSVEYHGTLGTQVVRIFDLVASRTGFKDSDAREYGYDPVTVETKTLDHKAYYPNARELRIRLTGDRLTGKLLGAQLLGETATEAAKRIDTFATALHAGCSVGDLLKLDLSYTPPLGSPWDPIHQAAMNWLNTVK